MRHIVHGQPPNSLAAEFARNPSPANPKNAWKKFDKTETRQALSDLQSGLCAYCERPVPSVQANSVPLKHSIDHIEPKSAQPRGTFRFDNLLLCCDDTMTCNLKKGDQYFQGFISPVQPHAPTAFLYEPNGGVSPAGNGHHADAQKTLEILNLDAGHLRTARKAVFDEIDEKIVELGLEPEGPEAIRRYLARELSLTNILPHLSAKLQLYAKVLQ